MRAPAAGVAIRAVFFGAGTWLVVDEARILALGRSAMTGIGGRGAHDAVLMLLVVLCLTRAFSRPRRRAAWILVGLGMLAWAFGEIYFNAELWWRVNPPTPSPADAGYLTFYPLCLAGLTVMVRSRAGRPSPMRLVDGLTAAMAIGAVSAVVVVSPVITHDAGAPLAFATNLAYPLLDTILLAAVFGALAGMGWRADRGQLLLAGGLLLFLLADSLYDVRTAVGTYHPGSWFDTGWYFGFYLIAAAAWQSTPAPLGPRDEVGTRQIGIPLLFGSVGLGVLVYGCVARTTWLAVGLAAASVVAVMVRLLLTFRENVAMLRDSRAEAHTDALTGLGNRRALVRRLEDVFSAAPPVELELALFDLDGFKAYNDRFGHPAGDALLSRLAARLQAAVGPDGDAYRLGGDEFCALVPAAPSHRAELVQRLTAALSETGDSFTVGASCGAISLPGEASDIAQALRMADHGLYAHKQARRGTGERRAGQTAVPRGLRGTPAR